MHSTRYSGHVRRRWFSGVALFALIMAAGLATTGGAAEVSAAAPKVLETIDVPAGTKPGDITSATSFDPKKRYSITVTGTVISTATNGTTTVDAVYCVTGPSCLYDSSGNPVTPPTWHSAGVLGIRDAGNLFSSLDEFKGCCPLKRQIDYSDTHTYTISFKNIGGPITLYDPNFSNGQISSQSGEWVVVISSGKVKPASPTCKPKTPLGFPNGCPDQ